MIPRLVDEGKCLQPQSALFTSYVGNQVPDTVGKRKIALGLQIFSEKAYQRRRLAWEGKSPWLAKVPKESRNKQSIVET